MKYGSQDGQGLQKQGMLGDQCARGRAAAATQRPLHPLRLEQRAPRSSPSAAMGLPLGGSTQPGWIRQGTRPTRSTVLSRRLPLPAHTKGLCCCPPGHSALDPRTRGEGEQRHPGPRTAHGGAPMAPRGGPGGDTLQTPHLSCPREAATPTPRCPVPTIVTPRCPVPRIVTPRCPVPAIVTPRTPTAQPPGWSDPQVSCPWNRSPPNPEARIPRLGGPAHGHQALSPWSQPVHLQFRRPGGKGWPGLAGADPGKWGGRGRAPGRRPDEEAAECP